MKFARPVPHVTQAFKVFKSNKPSSQRTQGAAIAHVSNSLLLSNLAQTLQDQRSNHKFIRQVDELLDVVVPPQTNVHMWSDEELNGIHLVFDGGDLHNPPLARPTTLTKDPSPFLLFGSQCSTLFVSYMLSFDLRL